MSHNLLTEIMKKNKLFILSLIIFTSFSLQAQIPTGYYYFLRGKNKAELKSTLAEVSTPLNELDYGSGEGYTWEGFYKTDRNPDNTVVDMYSSIIRSFDGYNSVSGMAIEHSFPKSWWGGFVNTAYKDLFNLYPADAETNTVKSNLPLGEVTSGVILDNGVSKIGVNGFETTYTGDCFEPADEYKGDFARSYMYMVSIYENLANLWDSPMLITNKPYPGWQPWAIDLLLKWSRQDPVSAKEIARNDSVYAIQNNRNPFINHPELAEYIWGNDTTNTFDYPAETGAFLISPRRMTKLDFGVILVNGVKSTNLTIQGVNINSPITLSFARKSASLSASNVSISASDAINGYNLQISYNPTINGETNDTLLISGGGMTEVTRVPIKAMATSDFIVTEADDITPVGANLHWLDDPYATDYKVSLFQGDTKAGNVIISSYYEGASNNKAIELYNGTGVAVDLSTFEIKKQTNGEGDYSVAQRLSGTLQNGNTYVIVYNPPSTQYPVSDWLNSKANAFSDSVCAFNGNDAIALFRNGVPVDIVGKLNGGADYIWGEDKMLIRNADITHPTMHFNLSDWTEYAYTDSNRFGTGTHTMNLASSSNYILQDVSAGTNTFYLVENLNPQQKYTYQVTSYRSGTVIPSVNTMQFKTSDLEVPMALDATDVGAASFNANLAESSYADTYYLNVFNLSGAIITDVEGFNSVGSNGQPLPTGWTGTASGSYTSTASSGVTPPSLKFGNSGEWLQIKQFSDTINSLNFMYRFPSSGTGSYMTVQAQNQACWTKIDSISYVNTSKYYPSYNFSRSDGYTAIKFTYTKVSGNFALDDIYISHGGIDTVFVLNNYPVYALEYNVDNLSASSEYYYNVRAKRGETYSDYSNVVKVVTLTTGTKNVQNHSYKIATLRDAVSVLDLNGNENIQLYSITGSLLKSIKATSNSVYIPISNHGIYVLQIENEKGKEVYKIVK